MRCLKTINIFLKSVIMKYLKHQKKFGKKLKKRILKKGYAYLKAPPRSGKTATALWVAENIDAISNVLIVTKKNAFSGWEKFINSNLVSKNYKVINKESIHKVDTSNIHFVILDEAHIYGGLGKPTITHTKMRDKLWNIPQLLMSATPLVESNNNIYYQMTKSKYNPFREHRNFYSFFREYGKSFKMTIYNREVETYKKNNKKLDKLLGKLIIEMPKQFEMETQDKLHYVNMSDKQKKVYNTLVKERYYYEYISTCCGADSEPLRNDGGIIGECSKCKKNTTLIPYEMTADSKLKLLLLLHQVEGGVVKCDNEDTFIFNEQPKIDYIKDKWGDKKDIGIMAHFIQERELLKQHFKHATIYSSNANAEGVDLSHLKAFIIYSQDYSGAKHIQRRDRIVNMNGSNTLDVNYLVVKKGVSEQVYKTCSKKLNFNNKTFKGEEI